MIQNSKDTRMNTEKNHLPTLSPRLQFFFRQAMYGIIFLYSFMEIVYAYIRKYVKNIFIYLYRYIYIQLYISCYSEMSRLFFTLETISCLRWESLWFIAGISPARWCIIFPLAFWHMVAYIPILHWICFLVLFLFFK